MLIGGAEFSQYAIAQIEMVESSAQFCITLGNAPGPAIGDDKSTRCRLDRGKVHPQRHLTGL